VTMSLETKSDSSFDRIILVLVTFVVVVVVISPASRYLPIAK